MSESRGMVVSLGGVLRRAAVVLDSHDDTGLNFMVRQLHDHLEEFRRRHESGEEKVADEFFGLYVE